VWAGPYVRIFVDALGDSHFEDIAVPLESPSAGGAGPVQRLSPLPASSIVLQRVSAAEYQPNWHPAPDRQFVVVMSGRMEIEVSDGQVRQFGPGRVVLVEDTTGKGHLTRVGLPVTDPAPTQPGPSWDPGWVELMVIKVA
jgi:hypothetical protein